MLAAGLVEVKLGVDAEQRPLEEISAPLSAVGEGEDEQKRLETAGPARSLPRQTGPAPVPRRWRGATLWAPAQLSSTYPPDDPYLAKEVDALVASLEARSPQSGEQLARSVSARVWGPGRFRQAVRSGIASGRVRHIGRNRYALRRPSGDGSVSPGDRGRSLLGPDRRSALVRTHGED